MTDRISHTFEAPGVKAAEIAQLISELETDLAPTRDAGAEARAKARDPLTAHHEVTSARMQETDASFREERLTVAIERLKQRHTFAVAREKEMARKAEIAEIEEERDQLLQELREKYPRLAGELADLMARVKANNDKCRAHYLSGPEHVARGMRPSDVNFLTAAVRLPALDNHEAEMGERYWPPLPHRLDSASILPPHIVEAMRRAGEESRRTTKVGRAIHAENRGKATKRLPA
jgi:hypothetical protein